MLVHGGFGRSAVRRQASTGFLAGEHTRPPRVGYAPPEYRIEQWAHEPLIEGWFPQNVEDRKLAHNRQGQQPGSFPTPVMSRCNKTWSLQTPGDKQLEKHPHHHVPQVEAGGQTIGVPEV